jgi:protein DGCR14
MSQSTTNTTTTTDTASSASSSASDPSSSTSITAQTPAASSLVVGAPQFVLPKKRKEKVLDEDEYVDALQTIIQRDFFPDLPKLRARLEWIEAEEANDIVKMREIQQRLLSTARRPTTGIRGK